VGRLAPRQRALETVARRRSRARRGARQAVLARRSASGSTLDAATGDRSAAPGWPHRRARGRPLVEPGFDGWRRDRLPVSTLETTARWALVWCVWRVRDGRLAHAALVHGQSPRQMGIGARAVGALGRSTSSWRPGDCRGTGVATLLLRPAIVDRLL